MSKDDKLKNIVEIPKNQILHQRTCILYMQFVFYGAIKARKNMEEMYVIAYAHMKNHFDIQVHCEISSQILIAKSI